MSSLLNPLSAGEHIPLINFSRDRSRANSDVGAYGRNYLKHRRRVSAAALHAFSEVGQH
jgi:hypothetical protein